MVPYGRAAGPPRRGSASDASNCLALAERAGQNPMSARTGPQQPLPNVSVRRRKVAERAGHSVANARGLVVCYGGF